jgi:hypothetical protein
LLLAPFRERHAPPCTEGDTCRYRATVKTVTRFCRHLRLTSFVDEGDSVQRTQTAACHKARAVCTSKEFWNAGHRMRRGGCLVARRTAQACLAAGPCATRGRASHTGSWWRRSHKHRARTMTQRRDPRGTTAGFRRAAAPCGAAVIVTLQPPALLPVCACATCSRRHSAARAPSYRATGQCRRRASARGDRVAPLRT